MWIGLRTAPIFVPKGRTILFLTAQTDDEVAAVREMFEMLRRGEIQVPSFELGPAKRSNVLRFRKRGSR